MHFNKICQLKQYALIQIRTAQKATIHQVTAMVSTSKNVLFPGDNHQLTTGADDLTL